MKWIPCQNNTTYSKKLCKEEVFVDENTVKALCWKCVADMLPTPEIKKPTGYPRGWKFMTEFVDSDGNVYHKGVIQPKLFGKKQPTKIEKKTVKRQKKESLDQKIMAEFSKRANKKKVKRKK